MWRTGLVIGLLWTSTLARAQETAPATTAPANVEVRIPEPGEGDFDWVRLTNGEVLKGEIVELHDDSFVFDSDELGKFTIDWDKVAEVLSKKPRILMFRGRKKVEVKSVEIDQTSVRVVTAAAPEAEPEAEPAKVEETFERENLRMIVPGGDRELDYWSGKLSLGLTARSGNVDQTDLSGFVEIQRRTAITRGTFEYTVSYSEVDSTKTAENHRATAAFDYYLTDRLYLRPAFLTFYRDPFQNIKYRLTPGAGLGYELVNTQRFDWDVGAGIGWQHTEFQDPLPGASSSEDSFVGLVGTNFEWEVTSKVDVGLDFDMTVPVPEADDFQFRLVAWTEVDIVGDLDLDVRFTWDRVNDPQPKSDGTVPDPDDYRLYIGVGWDF